ncbi:hypothetical protein CS060_11390 [Anoxybacillus flavithermus]|uniref:Uncharacterized protein n=1 Tax=Anoxybacillus flavithermus TaxID=33934 RepID=A0A2G5RMZ5_9BACL|nr:hypothetical protein CS060_11390 [Anoxybacillus flavithermus]
MFNPELYFYYILLPTLLVFTHLFHKRTKDLSKTLLITITALFFVSVVCSVSLALNYYQSWMILASSRIPHFFHHYTTHHFIIDYSVFHSYIIK